MTTTQIAQKYGVPIPETCTELNWQGETHFYWGYFRYSQQPTETDLIPRLLYYVGLENGKKQFVVVKECHHLLDLECVQSWERINPDERDYEIYASPQMHEIAIFLEDKLQTLRLCLEHKSEHLYTIDEVTNEVDFCVNVCRSNYAEAYAQIYLEFKNEGIIS